jgi:hypothetical protein
MPQTVNYAANASLNNGYVLQAAINAYADEAYTNAKKLSGTGIVGDNPQIKTDTETFIGQMRWYKPLNPTINIASLATATDGTATVFTSDYLTYIKTLRTHGVDKVNMTEVVTQVDGLAKVGRDFAETRAQDEHNAILSVLKGVAISEVLNGSMLAGGLGGQTWDNDPTLKTYGFYVDLAGAKPVIAASSTAQGAARAEGFLNAMGMAWKDYEPEYAYLVVSPEVLASIRSANLVDQTTITEGNVNFETIFAGKFRLIQTRAVQSFSSTEFTKLRTGAGVVPNVASVKTSFIVLPGALAMKALNVPVPTEIYRDARKYMGGGVTSMWYRWGYVAAPAGYDWAGPVDAFPSDADYGQSVMTGTSKGLLTAATLGATVQGMWNRKATSALSLGILPVLHA